MTDRILLDTNVLVYAHDASNPIKQAKAQQIIKQGTVSGKACVSAQVLGELFDVLTRKIAHPLTPADTLRLVQSFGKLGVIEISFLTVRLALHFVLSADISYWDALILAAARLGDCSTVYSEDLAHGMILDGVTVINPFHDS